MSFRVPFILLLSLACVCGAPTTVSQAAETLTFQASLHPDRLGAPTNVSVMGKFGSTTDEPPSPVTKVMAYLPAGMSIDTRGTGTCSAAVLTEKGPSACPPNSRGGFGGGVGVFELAGELIREPFTIDLFFAPREAGRLAVLVYVLAESPALVELVLVAKEISAPKPFGLGFSLEVPAIATLPGASDASVESAFFTFGATNVAYYETVHGKKTLVHVKGLVVPKVCPRRGFPLEGIIDFADGSSLTARSTIPCPGG